MSRSFAPRGTQLQRSDGPMPGSAFTTIAEVISVERTGSKGDSADVTNMDSSSHREFLQTLTDEGTLNMDVNFIPGDATQQKVNTDFENQVTAVWQVVLPNSLGTYGPIAGFVEGNDWKLPIDKQGTRALKIKLSGAPVAQV